MTSLRQNRSPDIRCNCTDCRKGVRARGRNSDLVLPSDVVHLDNIQVKTDGLPVYSAQGRRIWVYHFELRAGGFHESAYVTVEEGMSRGHIEDIIGAAQERFVQKVAQVKAEKSGKHAPSPDERDDISEVLKDLNNWRKKKRAGTAPILFVP